MKRYSNNTLLFKVTNNDLRILLDIDVRLSFVATGLVLRLCFSRWIRHLYRPCNRGFHRVLAGEYIKQNTMDLGLGKWPLRKRNEGAGEKS